jgi:SpoVK/Ycf46/Vps4 family AAA+-type ATPase
MWDSGKKDTRIKLGIQPTILIYGPPGTGKTSLVENLAKEFNSEYNAEGFHFVKSNLNSLLSHDLGRSSKNLDKFFDDIFKKARQQKRVLVHLDDAESALTSRMGGSESKGVFRFVTTALGKLDDLIGADLMYSPVIVLSTNMIKVLDPAVDRRFTHRFRFDPTLSEEHIREMSTHYLADSIDEYSDFVEALFPVMILSKLLRIRFAEFLKWCWSKDLHQMMQFYS